MSYKKNICFLLFAFANGMDTEFAKHDDCVRYRRGIVNGQNDCVRYRATGIVNGQNEFENTWNRNAIEKFKTCSAKSVIVICIAIIGCALCFDKYNQWKKQLEEKQSEDPQRSIVVV
jgi:hypothetical protein